MSKILKISYNGEQGSSAKIEDVVQFIFKIFEINSDQFLDFKGSDKTNRELVFDHYSESEKIRHGFLDENGNKLKDYTEVKPSMPCPYMTFYIEAKYVTKSVILSNSNVLTDDFTSKELTNEEFMDDSTFLTNKFFYENVRLIKPINKITPDTARIDTRRQYLNPKVWIWCKALNENGQFNNHSIFDLSPFVESINTSTSETGGQFSIQLLNIEGFITVMSGFHVDGVWNPKKERYIKFVQGNKNNFVFRNVVNARFQFDENFDGSTKLANKQTVTNREIENVDLSETVDVERSFDECDTSISSDFFFKNIISENDIIFITFRDDEDNVVEKVDDFFVGHDSLPGNDWDMIGLVDRNSMAVRYEDADLSVEVSGRDLMKLLIEDGSYFFANSFADEDVKSIFDNIDLPNKGDGVNASNQVLKNGQKGANRLVMSGMIDMLFVPEARNVHFVMNLLMSTLSNMEVCNTRLFEYYGDKITKFQIPMFETIKK